MEKALLDTDIFSEVLKKKHAKVSTKAQQDHAIFGRANPMIAAMALEHDLVLITGNVQHYKHIRQVGYALKLKNWKQ